MDEIKVQIKEGQVVLRKPKARHFSKAMEEAEIGNGEVKMTKMFNILLPYCVKEHPWGMKKVSDGIGDLDIDEYLKLFNEIKNLVNVQDNETVGKSEPLSTEEDSPESSG